MPQTSVTNSIADNPFTLNSRLTTFKNFSQNPASINSDDPVGASYIFFLLIYALNPILLYENGGGKGSWGFTKEVTLGFGEFGQYRISAEYSFVDKRYNQNMLRAGIKYDILLNKKINKYDDVNSAVLTIGGGYITDFDNYGYFPEITFGYSVRYLSDHLLLYPSIKLRYSIMNDSPDMTDLSAGIILGFTNPFTEFEGFKSKEK
ncbi:MAG TPA: hypothetical protein PKC91_15150 [Ignavibacteria bacterium]|nr:hypothetical protein [Ignavibacteria bacterium]